MYVHVYQRCTFTFSLLNLTTTETGYVLGVFCGEKEMEEPFKPLYCSFVATYLHFDSMFLPVYKDVLSYKLRGFGSQGVLRKA